MRKIRRKKPPEIIQRVKDILEIDELSDEQKITSMWLLLEAYC
jgi:hypothetical protein